MKGNEIKGTNGERYLLVDGVVYPIGEKATELPQQEKQQEKTVKKQEIKPKELEQFLKDLSVKRTINLFGKLNKDNPYKVDKANFWKKYQFPTGNKHAISKRLVREQVIIKQMKSLKMSVSAQKQILNRCREKNYEGIKDWEKKGNKWAVESLARENISIAQQIKKM